MNQRAVCRPSLKITLWGDQAEANRFRIEVWNPFRHEYQPINSIDEGMARVQALAQLIGRMWMERHPKWSALQDVPNAAQIDGMRWAELRVDATISKSYETRSDDRPAWARASGMGQAATTVCKKVGYALPGTASP
jgi:hypothetical protein